MKLEANWDMSAALSNVIFSMFHDSFIQASKNFDDHMLAVFCRRWNIWAEQRCYLLSFVSSNRPVCGLWNEHSVPYKKQSDRWWKMSPENSPVPFLSLHSSTARSHRLSLLDPFKHTFKNLFTSLCNKKKSARKSYPHPKPLNYLAFISVKSVALFITYIPAWIQTQTNKLQNISLVKYQYLSPKWMGVEV